MSARHLVLNEMAISILPARQYGLNAANTKALLHSDTGQLARLSNSRTKGCSFFVASNVPAISTGCHFIVAAEAPKH